MGHANLADVFTQDVEKSVLGMVGQAGFITSTKRYIMLNLEWIS